VLTDDEDDADRQVDAGKVDSRAGGTVGVLGVMPVSCPVMSLPRGEQRSAVTGDQCRLVGRRATVVERRTVGRTLTYIGVTQVTVTAV